MLTTSLKQAPLRLAAAAGIFDICRGLTRDWPRIISYHHFCEGENDHRGAVGAATLRRQIAYLQEHFEIVHLSALGEQLARGVRPRTPTAVLTVDDGYCDFAAWALPVLIATRTPVTLAIIPGLIDAGDWLWADHLTYAAEQGQAIGTVDPLAAAGQLRALKRLPVEARNAGVAAFIRQSRVEMPVSPPPHYQLLDWSDLREMKHAAGDLLEFASHTCTHPILTSLTDAAAEREIVDSRRLIADRLGAAPPTFCYPNGLHADFTTRHMATVRNAGYVCATANLAGCVTRRSDRFALPRIGGDRPWLQFRKGVDGVENLSRTNRAP